MAAITPYGHQAFHGTIAATTAGDTTLLAAKTGVAFRIVSLYFISSETNTVKFMSGATDLSGEMDFTNQEGINLPMNPYGHMETTAGDAFIINLSAADKVAGFFTYFEV